MPDTPEATPHELELVDSHGLLFRVQKLLVPYLCTSCLLCLLLIALERREGGFETKNRKTNER